MSLILVDDHQLFREGMQLLLSNLDYVNEVKLAANAHELFQLLEQRTPDIIFMDIDMPETDGIEACRQVLKMYPGTNIIALSMYGEEDYYTRMIEAGAKGFILKNSGIDDVEASIKNVMAGKNYFSQEILSGLLNSINRKNQPQKNTDLSERETEVLYQICKGLSNQEIADVLNISKRTVDKHRENILSKSGTKNTAGLVMFAIKNGVVEV
ncbi:MAG: response regulator transcription factor [Prolixibacteraceae bacterium]|nr:response regulator transcription factor [Prolixibacteraceae bacterium]MBN2648168.1 response regulator transcription factor [Prolixibacteraceae bacterium]